MNKLYIEDRIAFLNSICTTGYIKLISKVSPTTQILTLDQGYQFCMSVEYNLTVVRSCITAIAAN